MNEPSSVACEKLSLSTGLFSLTSSRCVTHIFPMPCASSLSLLNCDGPSFDNYFDSLTRSPSPYFLSRPLCCGLAFGIDRLLWKARNKRKTSPELKAAALLRLSTSPRRHRDVETNRFLRTWNIAFLRKVYKFKFPLF